MSEPDIFQDMAQIEADLQMQECILWSKAALALRLVEASVSKAPEVEDTLRIEAMYQFAEFFYLLKGRNISDAESIAKLADFHNAHIESLTRDKEKMRRLGLRSDRLLKAIFTSDTMPRLVETWRDRPGCFDQSNLARFLATVMSPETCRTLILASEKAGFLDRARSPFGAVLVSSTGVMEHVFGHLLRDLRLKITAINVEAPKEQRP